jgi:hypothetical protein
MAEKPYDFKADVYSFALIMWELVTNEVPFENLDIVSLIRNVAVKGERPKFPTADSRCPSELIELIKICWNQKPYNRPSFADLIKAFEALESKFPTVSSPMPTVSSPMPTVSSPMRFSNAEQWDFPKNWEPKWQARKEYYSVEVKSSEKVSAYNYNF